MPVSLQDFLKTVSLPTIPAARGSRKRRTLTSAGSKTFVEALKDAIHHANAHGNTTPLTAFYESLHSDIAREAFIALIAPYTQIRFNKKSGKILFSRRDGNSLKPIDEIATHRQDSKEASLDKPWYDENEKQERGQSVRALSGGRTGLKNSGT